MSDRFYLDPVASTLDGDRAELGGDEAHHFSRVMRGRVGDEIVLFDGSGLSWRGRVESVGKSKVVIHILETVTDGIESPLRLTVATAMPKGDRQRFLVEKLAELGVARLVPIRLDRSVARVAEGTASKLKRYVVESAKQCGRNVLMEIEPERSLEELDTLLGEDHARWILHPVSLGEVGQKTARALLADGLPEKVAVLVGPEGSFTDREVEFALETGFRPLDLGARILRTETAAVAAAALMLTWAG